MAAGKVSSAEYLVMVSPEHQAFAEALHNGLIGQGCTLAIKEAKSGCAASYLFDKKTIMNWVLPRSGVLARIYGDHAGRYEDVIASLPTDM